MLESIRITNLALIDKSSVNFYEGFNVLTGETGAGKSLIVDALLFLTGVRADKTFIKSGAEFSRVEGVFSVEVNDSAINAILSSVGIENDGTLIIFRQFNLNGKNECRINGELVTLNIIRKLSSLIIDIFGQNDSQILLDSDNHLILFDNMIESELYENKAKLNHYLEELKCINNSITELGGLDKDRQNNINFVEFQIKEIDNAELFVGQEEEIKSKITIMQNSEKILSALSSASDILDGEFSLENAIKSSINYLSSIEQFDSDLTIQKDRLYSIRYELQDIVSEICNKKDSVVYSEQELDMLEDKLMQIKDLERKYGNTIEEVLKTREELSQRLAKLVNADEELDKLTKDKTKLLRSIFDICIDLHEIRVREVAKFRSKLLFELKDLGMKNADFAVNYLNNISLDNIESLVDENGADKIEFLFSANLGVEPRPLDKVISGGEMSRFMLAFKTLQNLTTNKTCIFDEIDTGIGGQIGIEIGKKICQISRNTQVICITHLAQIASFGDNNFLIEKVENDSSTITSVKQLNKNDKVEEIARMLGGQNSTVSLNLAQDMINDAEGYKSYIKG